MSYIVIPSDKLMLFHELPIKVGMFHEGELFCVLQEFGPTVFEKLSALEFIGQIRRNEEMRECTVEFIFDGGQFIDLDSRLDDCPSWDLWDAAGSSGNRRVLTRVFDFQWLLEFASQANEETHQGSICPVFIMPHGASVNRLFRFGTTPRLTFVPSEQILEVTS